MASRSQCKRALEDHADALEKYRNVVGMGVVRLDEAAQAERGSTDAVAVYVRKKLPEKELAPHEVIPRFLNIKGRGKSIRVPTKVIEQGEVSLESPGVESL